MHVPVLIKINETDPERAEMLAFELLDKYTRFEDKFIFELKIPIEEFETFFEPETVERNTIESRDNELIELLFQAKYGEGNFIDGTICAAEGFIPSITERIVEYDSFFNVYEGAEASFFPDKIFFKGIKEDLVEIETVGWGYSGAYDYHYSEAYTIEGNSFEGKALEDICFEFFLTDERVYSTEYSFDTNGNHIGKKAFEFYKEVSEEEDRDSYSLFIASVHI